MNNFAKQGQGAGLSASQGAGASHNERMSSFSDAGNRIIRGDEGRRALAAAEVARSQTVRNILIKLIKSIVMVLGYVIFGWMWFRKKYDWTFTDCFYFAMVTVTTGKRRCLYHYHVPHMHALMCARALPVVQWATVT